MTTREGGASRVERGAPSSADTRIRFDNVDKSFHDNEVLHDISFAVARGERIALVSESGGGKTTLVNLLLGLYRPDAGAISIAGTDTAGQPPSTVRAQIGVVFQDASLFSGTVRENLAYGRPEATDTELEQAARRANAHEFITKLSDGYDTLIGERGVRLSGGQKQRIAVARAMLKDAPLLVLDEATSALDTQTERAIQRSLAELAEGRTTLVIAHRLATVRDADRIVVVDENGIAEQGSHEELVARPGIYRALHHAQSF